MAGGVRRSFSFEVLRQSPDDDREQDGQQNPQQQQVSKRRRRRKTKKASLPQSLSLSPRTSADLAAFVQFSAPSQPRYVEDPLAEVAASASQHAEDPTASNDAEGCKRNPESEISDLAPTPAAIILRQRPVGSTEKSEEAERTFFRSNSKKLENGASPVPISPGKFDVNGTENPEWKQVITDDAEHPEAVEFSPFQYMSDELSTGAWITTRTGSDNCEERVFNLIYHVPWRCELLMDVGFFVCLDSFLSLLTVMPVRLSIALWKWFRRLRPMQAEDVRDLGCLVILIVGVYCLQLADISFIYHSIRFEPNIKLYMIYNILELFDKVFQSAGVDVFEFLLVSADSYVKSAKSWLGFLLALIIAAAWFTFHSFIILSEAIALSVALHHVASNSKSLLVLLMSNNFAEIKSNVFKRFTKDNMHYMTHTDTVERFHISTFLFFVFVQNIMIVEGPWMAAFIHNAALVMLCEAFVDLLKHSFLARSNQLNPTAYSEFLKSLCEQVLRSRKKDPQKGLHFIPIGPACVVIRVLLPLYGAFMASQSCWRNWFWSSVLALGTLAFLAASKVVVGFSLRTYAAWYLKRCHNREKHHHAD